MQVHVQNVPTIDKQSAVRDVRQDLPQRSQSSNTDEFCVFFALVRISIENHHIYLQIAKKPLFL